MAKHKKQHFVPKSYLVAWSDPATPIGHEPYVWVFSKYGGPGKKRAPGNIFTETDMYTVLRADGTRDLYFENGLCQLETGMQRLRLDFLEPRKQLPHVPRLKLATFVAAMHCRTRRFRDHHREQWQQVAEMGAQVLAAMEKKTPKERARIAATSLPSSGGASFSMEDVQRVIDIRYRI